MSLKKNIIAFIVIGTIGTLSHFVFEWTNENYIAGLFFPVNESVWEHLKLLFFPVALYSVAEYFLMNRKPKNYLQATVFSVICGMFWIVALFYTVTGAVGYNIDFINILIYFISIIITLKKKNKIIEEEKFNSHVFYCIAVILAILFAILFIFWSYNPLSYGIFTPPV